MAHKQKKLTSQDETPSTRWWESYLVRYFVGFIVGAICVFFFLLETNLFNKFLSIFLDTTKGYKPDWSSIVFLATFLGIVYCYVASTPITVLHAGRFSKWFLEYHARHFWIGWLITCFYVLFFTTFENLIRDWSDYVSLTVAVIVILWLPVTSSFSGYSFLSNSDFDRNLKLKLQNIPSILLLIQSVVWFIAIKSAFFIAVSIIFLDATNCFRISKFTVHLWLLSLPVFWIGIVQYVVLTRIITEHQKLIQFYALLFNARRQLNAKDVRDSYTHLREHSNSVFIVIVELAILALLLAVNSTMRELSMPDHYQQLVGCILFGLAFWMIPTVFMWARANAIEGDFAKNPNLFLKK